MLNELGINAKRFQREKKNYIEVGLESAFSLTTLVKKNKTIKARTIWAQNSPPGHTINETCKRKIKSFLNMQGFRKFTGHTYFLGKLFDNIFWQTESNPRE